MKDVNLEGTQPMKHGRRIYPRIVGNLWSLSDFLDPDLANRVFDAIENTDPALLPHKYGPCEPLRNLYAPPDRRSLLRAWLFEHTLLMNAKAPSQATYFTVWGKTAGRFNHLSVDVALDWAAKPGKLNVFLSLLERLAGIAGAVFGTVHVLVEPPVQGLEVADLKIRLPFPDRWALLFGAPYVELFGLDRLLATPCHHVDVLPSGHIKITLTPSPMDPAQRAQAELARVHLGRDAFMDPGKSYRTYRTGLAPVFDFGEITAERPFPPAY